jgi:ABC-2 type transport system ATP-binding protein
LTIRQGAAADAATTAAVACLAGVAAVEATDHGLRVGAEDPDAVAPAVVRALVAAGADVVEVRVEHTTLEQIYFDVMGVRPAGDEVIG